ncbi:hypothetical protein Tco_0780434 [Tanacetum coccineum]
MEHENEYYITHSDLPLWEVIVNGDTPAVASASAEGPIPPKTAELKLARKNELKAKSTLFVAIPDEHLLNFHGIKDAKTLWEAIKARSEGLDKTYDKFQKLISQLEIHGEVISQEDANMKLLRSLPSAWNNIALIMRNKVNLDELSIDDLYNNLKVYEAEIKSQSSSSSNSQNVAFVSSDDTSSTNEAVNTAHDVHAARSKGQASSSTYADDVMFSFFVNQSNSQQLDNEDREMILMILKRWISNGWGHRLHEGEVTLLENVGHQGIRGIEIGDAPRRNVPFETLQMLIPHPYTGNYMPSRPDLSFARLDDYVYKTNVSETISGVSRIKSTASKSSKNSLEQPKDVRPIAPIIKDWDTDSDNDSVFRPKPDQTKPSSYNIRKVESRVDKRNWNGIMTQKLEMGNPQYAFQDQGIFNSRCSRHMTGNKYYLTDYQDIDGGFVAFAGSPIGGGLKFYFSCPHICVTEEKTGVLFTKTKCLVLSPDFKPLDDSQALLKVPRHSNMYSFDPKNVVPLVGLTCLFAKATVDRNNS